MSDTARPIPERLGDQEEQAAHLVRTVNGPTVGDEAELLAEQYGPADMAGFHTGLAVVDEATADEPADEGAAPAADTAEGGESA
ncbi:hypothetical protein ABZ656_33860 [Streptomyces sp. NPDC007095]|uniref:hypothetical protein n=1 Tax=Streptomyces sp. NPDC007095 TaxID=3154482 RepID=UPI0033E4864F